jgi:hypothetical protein
LSANITGRGTENIAEVEKKRVWEQYSVGGLLHSTVVFISEFMVFAKLCFRDEYKKSTLWTTEEKHSRGPDSQQ